MNYVVFYSHGLPLGKGWHIGTVGKSYRCSKYGPFETEEHAIRTLERLKHEA